MCVFFLRTGTQANEKPHTFTLPRPWWSKLAPCSGARVPGLFFSWRLARSSARDESRRWTFHGARDGGLEPMRPAQSLTPSPAPRLGLTHFRVCLPVFLPCALPSHRSASDALTVLGGSSTLSVVAGGPGRQAAARFRDHGRGVAQGDHASDSASRQSSLTLPRPTLFSPFLLFLSSLSLSLYSVTA